MISLFEEGYPITGVSSDGRFSFSRDLTKTEKNNFDSFLASWDDSPGTEEKRQEAYKQAGITAERLIFALWKELKNADPTDSADLESRINDINAEIN